MPFFFLVSGLLFNPEKYLLPHHFIIKKWPTLIRPFIFFSIAVFIGLYLIDPEKFRFQTDNFLHIGWGGFALWFIPVLVLTEFLYLLICKLVRPGWMRCIFIIIMSGMGFTLYKFNVTNYWNLNFVLTAVLFFGIGNLIYKPFNEFMKVRNLRDLFLCLILCFLVSLVALINDPKPEFFINSLGGGIVTYIAAIFGALMLCFIANIISRITAQYLKSLITTFQYFGKNSYVVLAFHQIIVLALSEVCFLKSGVIVRMLMWMTLILIIELLTRYFPYILGRNAHKCVQ